MKKIINTICVSFLVFTLVGCVKEQEESTNATDKNSNINYDIVENKENTQDTQNTEDSLDDIVLSTIEGIDVDLTGLSSTMVFSQVYDMLYYPENYMGKVVKMRGQLDYFINPDNGKLYYACIIADALECCAEGFEFTWDKYTTIEEVPPKGTEVEVIGAYGIYEEHGFEYAFLESTSVEILE